MELLLDAKAIQLKSHHNKYLVANEGDESVCQDKNGKSSETARWSVELVQGGKFIRLKNCYGKYLTASDAPLLLGMTGKKVIQTLPPKRLDSDSSSVEWEPIRNGYSQIKLKSRYSGDYLRANGRLPPWRNSVTHDVPHRNRTQDWIIWDVDVLEVELEVELEVLEEVVLIVGEEVVAVIDEQVQVQVEEVKPQVEEIQVQVEGDGEEGSSSSRFGFRKFLHELNSTGGDSESSGGLLAGMLGSLAA